jgi:thiol:disulfide interchange protein DsbD
VSAPIIVLQRRKNGLGRGVLRYSAAMSNSPYARPLTGARAIVGVRARLLLLPLLSLASSVGAAPWWMQGANANPHDFLPPDEAFRVSARVDGDLLRVRWVIADGYYLYRRKIEVRAESPDLVVYAPVLPPGSSLSDPYFGAQEVYFQQVDATAAFARSDAGAHPLQIKVIYQGCAQAGLCYPPISKVIFPDGAAPVPAGSAMPAPPYSAAWEGVAIGGGALAFLLAGLLLRKGRRLSMPAT